MFLFISGAQTNYWILCLLQSGPLNRGVTANASFYAAFNNSLYVAYNMHSEKSMMVEFSDGTVFQVAPRSYGIKSPTTSLPPPPPPPPLPRLTSTLVLPATTFVLPTTIPASTESSLAHTVTLFSSKVSSVLSTPSPTATHGKQDSFSTDGSCGQSQLHSFKCPSKTCCSQFGWCGSGSDYCGVGCQKKFGSCSKKAASTPSASPPSPTTGPNKTVTIDGTCGKSQPGQHQCGAALCCSKFGYCGVGIDYCFSGCQAMYGKCS